MTEAKPVARRILHNIEANKMTYRFTNLVEIPPELNLADLIEKYAHDLEVKTWVQNIRSMEREIPMEFSDGEFDPEKMKGVVQSNLYNCVANAKECLDNLQKFLSAEAKAAADAERAAQGIEDDIIIGDESEEVELPEASADPVKEPALVDDETEEEDAVLAEAEADANSDPQPNPVVGSSRKKKRKK